VASPPSEWSDGWRDMTLAECRQELGEFEIPPPMRCRHVLSPMALCAVNVSFNLRWWGPWGRPWLWKPGGWHAS